MKASENLKDFAAAILVSMLPILDEKQKRQLTGVVASKLGYGGVTFVNSITGKSRNTISSGAKSFDKTSNKIIDNNVEHESATTDTQTIKRIRRPGGGRKSIEPYV